MCADEKLPAIDRIDRIESVLEAFEQVSDEGQDLFAIGGRAVGTADELVDSMNYLLNNMNVTSLQERLLNHGRISMPYQLPSDYENIFQYPAFSRRTERFIPPEHHQPCLSGRELMWDWVTICLEDSLVRADQVLPIDMEPFEHVMVHHMPARLDLSTWIAALMMRAATQKISHEIQIAGEVRQWQDSMTDNEILYRRLPSGLFQDVIYFAGEAKPGRLVWVPRDRFDLPFGHGRRFCRGVRAKLREVEKALIALARRIARFVAKCIVYQYCAPEVERRGHSIVDRKQIGTAVREIMGDAWFDLPFDLDGGLRNWSEDDMLKPDGEMHGYSVFLDEDED